MRRVSFYVQIAEKLKFLIIQLLLYAIAKLIVTNSSDKMLAYLRYVRSLRKFN